MGRQLVAVNTAPTSENRMHGDEARRYGFRGGLVPGVDVLAYLVDAALDEWGTEWLGGGRLAGRLVLPVYDGEPVEVTSTTADDGIDAAVVGPDGTVRATARLSRGVDGEPDPAGWPAVVTMPAPADRPPASAATLEPGTGLGTQRAGFHFDRSVSYLAEISEAAPAFLDDHLAHPGWLLRFSNWALSGSVRLGPWIHVSSDLQLVAPVHDGDELEVRAVVTDRYERKGHELVDLTAVYLVDGRLVAWCDHRAIWQPRRGD